MQNTLHTQGKQSIENNVNDVIFIKFEKTSTKSNGNIACYEIHVNIDTICIDEAR